MERGTLTEDEEVAYDWVSCAQLLAQGVSHEAVALTIERHGVYGWNAFDRFSFGKPDSRLAQDAILTLERAHAADKLAEIRGHDTPNLDGEAPLNLYGWRLGDLPEMESPRCDLPALRKSSVERRERSYNRAMRGLMILVMGRDPNVPKGGLRTQDAIAAHISENKDLYGDISKRTCEELFSAANRVKLRD